MAKTAFSHPGCIVGSCAAAAGEIGGQAEEAAAKPDVHHSETNRQQQNRALCRHSFASNVSAAPLMQYRSPVGRRSIVEHVTQVSAASLTVGFGADHQPAAVHASADRMRDRLPEAGPASTAVEFRAGQEEIARAAGAAKDAVAMLAVQGTGERAFSGLATQHAVLRWRQHASPLLVALRHRKVAADRRGRPRQPPDHRDQTRGTGQDDQELPPVVHPSRWLGCPDRTSSHRSIVTPDRSDAATDVRPGSPDRPPRPASRTPANDRAAAGASAHE